MTKAARSSAAPGAAAGEARSAAGAPALAAALALALVLAAAPPQARAEEQEGAGRPPAGTVSAVVETGGVFVHEPGFGRGLKYGAGVQFRTARRAAFEIVLERYAVPVEEGAGRDADGLGGLGPGRMDMASIVFNQHVYVLCRGPVRPFATFGVGFDFIRHRPDDPAAAPKRDIVDRLALQLGGGADVRLTDRLALTARVRYNMAKTWVQEAPFPERVRDVDPRDRHIVRLYGLGLTLGLKVAL